MDGLHDDICATRKGDKCNCPSAAFNHLKQDTAIPLVIDHTFNRNGRTWRVSVVAGTFIIGTAIDAQRDSNGEPVRDIDVIQVLL